MLREEFKAKANEVINTCNEYGFMQYKIMPYGFGMTVEELVRGWKDYDKCSISSREMMQDELVGFLPILEHWVEFEKEPKVRVRLRNGAVKDIAKSVVDDYIELGLAEVI